MSGIFRRIAQVVRIKRNKGLVGYDLEGNKYFELPSPLGGRTKRTVEYKVSRDLADYTSGTHRLPVQWTTWLSHTRPTPPTLDELQADSFRQSRLKPLIAAIEAREEAERIRQGYLPDPTSTDQVNLSIPSPSAPSSSRRVPSSPDQVPQVGRGTGGATSGGPTFSSDSSNAQPITRRSAAPAQSPSSSSTSTQPPAPAPAQSRYPQAPRTLSASSNPTTPPPSSATAGDPQTYSIPTPPSPSVPPPRTTLDPSQHTSAEDLRRLSEEDTKRRMKEVGVDTSTESGSTTGAGQPGSSGAGGLAPRRRGR